jgi:methyl-accepting chemotaxis protein
MRSRLAALMPSLSVRTRIVCLAVIPIIGIVTGGTAFMAGDAEVDRAFASSGQAAQVVDASRELMIALMTLDKSVKDFLKDPSYGIVKVFAASQSRARQSLDAMDAMNAGTDGKDIAVLRANVAALNDNFGKLVREQEELGFADTEGLNERLVKAGSAIEPTLTEAAAGISEGELKSLEISLLTMRRYEILYRQKRSEFVRQQLNDE